MTRTKNSVGAWQEKWASFPSEISVVTLLILNLVLKPTPVEAMIFTELKSDSNCSHPTNERNR